MKLSIITNRLTRSVKLYTFSLNNSLIVIQKSNNFNREINCSCEQGSDHLNSLSYISGPKININNNNENVKIQIK